MSQDNEPAPTRYAWRLRAEKAEARVTALEQIECKQRKRALAAEARVKELEQNNRLLDSASKYNGDLKDRAEARIKELEAALETEGDRWRWKVKELEALLAGAISHMRHGKHRREIFTASLAQAEKRR